MAKDAAKENALGRLHDKLAGVFCKVLLQYEERLDVLRAVDKENIEDAVLLELFDKGYEPNPAMLSAISKFLKDNEILYDSDELAELSSLERRLKDKRKNRGNSVSLSNLKVVHDG